MKSDCVQGLHIFFLTLVTVLINSTTVFAKDGLIVKASLGFPVIEITNPNGTTAAYEGLSVDGTLSSPIVGDKSFGIEFYGALRYHDLENTASGETLELANHIGPALGFSFLSSRLFLNVDFSYMKARHFLIGPVSNRAEFDYQTTNVTVGYSIPFGDLRLGTSFTYGSGAIKADESGLSKDSEIQEQSVWINISYQLQTSLGGIAKELIK